MIKVQSARNNCKDVFHAFLVTHATYAGNLEIPELSMENAIPHKLIPFSKIFRSSSYDSWIHFYEDVVVFERLWNNPKRYLPILQRFQGVISPDFSLYRDMPLVMQQWNTYRSRAIAHWLQTNQVPVIPNIRFGDERSYDFCCVGIPKHGTISIGSHGCIKNKIERSFFQRGLEYVINELMPQNIVVYGSTPSSIFGKYQENGIRIIQFNSDYSVTHSKAVSA